MYYRRAFVPGGTYFFTVVTHDRRPLFASPANIRHLDEAMASVRARHPFETIACVVLPDHIHTIWALPDSDDRFSTRWRLIKERFTRAYLKTETPAPRTDRQIARGEQPVWQRRFWEHVIRDDRDLSAHIDYIHYNPVRHGLVKAARDWPQSSFHGFVSEGTLTPDWGSDDLPTIPDWMLRTTDKATP